MGPTFTLPLYDKTTGWKSIVEETLKAGSLHCGSKSEYQKYMKAFNARKQKEQEQQALQNDVSQLKSEMSDIKSLLLTLVQNQNHDSWKGISRWNADSV